MAGFVLGFAAIVAGIVFVTSIDLKIFLCGLVGLPLMIISLLSTRTGALMPARKVTVYPDGYVDEFRGKTSVVRWTEIKTVLQKIVRYYGYVGPIGANYAYVVTLMDGRTLTYANPLPDIAGFGDILQKAVTQIQLPKVITAVDAGEAVSFGRLTLMRDGIKFQGILYMWDMIDKVFLNAGLINVRLKGANLATGWPTQKVHDTPNVFVFLGLVSHYFGGVQ